MPDAFGAQYFGDGFNPERSCSSKDSQVVVRLTLKVTKEEAANIIGELHGVIEGDVTVEVPQSSLPIKGIIQRSGKIARSRVKKWVAVTAED